MLHTARLKGIRFSFLFSGWVCDLRFYERQTIYKGEWVEKMPIREVFVSMCTRQTIGLNTEIVYLRALNTKSNSNWKPNGGSPKFIALSRNKRLIFTGDRHMAHARINIFSFFVTRAKTRIGTEPREQSNTRKKQHQRRCKNRKEIKLLDKNVHIYTYTNVEKPNVRITWHVMEARWQWHVNGNCMKLKLKAKNGWFQIKCCKWLVNS